METIKEEVPRNRYMYNRIGISIGPNIYKHFLHIGIGLLIFTDNDIFISFQFVILIAL